MKPEDTVKIYEFEDDTPYGDVKPENILREGQVTILRQTAWTCEMHGETTNAVMQFWDDEGRLEYTVCTKCLREHFKREGLKDLSKTAHPEGEE